MSKKEELQEILDQLAVVIKNLEAMALEAMAEDVAETSEDAAQGENSD